MAPKGRFVAYNALVTWQKTWGDPHHILAQMAGADMSAADAAFARELFFGVLKMKRKIDYYINSYARFSRLAAELRAVLRLGFYQLLETPDIPAYAVVSEAVELAREISGAKNAGFVNAMLRSYLRCPDKVKLPDFERDPVNAVGVRLSYPNWLVRRYLKRFGMEQTRQWLELANRPPETFFFINSYIADEKTVEDELRAEVVFEKVAGFDGYYRALDPAGLIRSRSFFLGRVIINDPAQSLAVKALEPQPQATVLDPFAAPGGKTAALAIRAGRGGRVLASDISLPRLRILKGNIRRWGLDNVRLFAADALWYPSVKRFFFILADVPCSGTGTLRRNPDLRWRLKPTDLARLSKTQFRLLQAMADLLQPGGVMVYSTCSLEPEENEVPIRKFVAQYPEFHIQNRAMEELSGTLPGAIYTFPWRDGVDGVFAVAIRRRKYV